MNTYTNHIPSTEVMDDHNGRTIYSWFDLPDFRKKLDGRTAYAKTIKNLESHLEGTHIVRLVRTEQFDEYPLMEVRLNSDQFDQCLLVMRNHAQMFDREVAMIWCALVQPWSNDTVVKIHEGSQWLHVYPSGEFEVRVQETWGTMQIIKHPCVDRLHMECVEQSNKNEREAYYSQLKQDAEHAPYGEAEEKLLGKLRDKQQALTDKTQTINIRLENYTYHEALQTLERAQQNIKMLQLIDWMIYNLCNVITVKDADARFGTSYTRRTVAEAIVETLEFQREPISADLLADFLRLVRG